MPAGSFSVSITETEHFWIQCNRSNDYYQLQSFVNMSSNEDKRKKVDEAVIDDSMKCSDCGMYPCSNQFCLRDDAVIDDSMKSRLLIPPEFPGIPLNSFLWEFKGRKPRFPFRGTPKGTRRKISSVMYVQYVLYVLYIPFAVPLLWLEEGPFPLLQKEFPGNMRNSLHFLPSIPKRNKGSKRN